MHNVAQNSVGVLGGVPRRLANGAQQTRPTWVTVSAKIHNKYAAFSRF
jgi:hypothetical protein